MNGKSVIRTEYLRVDWAKGEQPSEWKEYEMIIRSPTYYTSEANHTMFATTNVPWSRK